MTGRDLAIYRRPMRSSIHRAVPVHDGDGIAFDDVMAGDTGAARRMRKEIPARVSFR